MRIAVVALAIVGAAACSQPPYTTDDGRADLIEAGFSAREADCVLDRLDAYFREEFLDRQEAEGIENVSRQQVDNYVKNRFAGISDVPTDLVDETRRAVTECG